MKRLLLVIFIALFHVGCNEKTQTAESTDVLVKPIEVETIEVETIIVETYDTNTIYW